MMQDEICDIDTAPPSDPPFVTQASYSITTGYQARYRIEESRFVQHSIDKNTICAQLTNTGFHSDCQFLPRVYL